MTKEIIFLDACLSDYFQGFSGDVFCVPVDGSTTYAELRSGLLDDINATGWALEDWTNDDVGAAIDDLFSTVSDMDAAAFPSMEVVEEDQEMPYAYFGVRDL